MIESPCCQYRRRLIPTQARGRLSVKGGGSTAAGGLPFTGVLACPRDQIGRGGIWSARGLLEVEPELS